MQNAAVKAPSAIALIRCEMVASGLKGSHLAPNRRMAVAARIAVDPNEKEKYFDTREAWLWLPLLALVGAVVAVSYFLD